MQVIKNKKISFFENTFFFTTKMIEVYVLTLLFPPTMAMLLFSTPLILHQLTVCNKII